MRTPLLWLPILILTAPLAAQEIDAPEPRWPVVMSVSTDSTPTDESSDFETAAQAQNESSSAGWPGAAADPVTQPRMEGAERSRESERRTLGVCAPSLTVVNDAPDIPPLTAGQKFKIFWRQQYNPCRYASAAFSAGIEQAQDEPPEYGQGMEGYGKRVGANLADANLSTLFGRSLLPIVLHDDPRYFRLGSKAPFKKRIVHALVSPEWTRRDNGSHRFNYSRVLGTFMATGVGLAYYPESERDAGSYFERSLSRLGKASAASLFHEFWPDIKAKIFKKRKPEPEP